MKKIGFGLWLVLGSIQLLQAQLYVSPTSYIYANNQLVYVNQEVELNQSDSFFYLRNGAQLLQGTIGAGKNKGLGALSVFQEGTVNNYQYNYWCSPVGNVNSNTTVNNPFGIRQLGAPTTATATNPTTILAYPALDGTSAAGSVSIAERWVHVYRGGAIYNDWVYVGANYNVQPGEGFIMKGTSGTDTTIPHTGAGENNPGSKQRYDFRGKPNDGTITNAVSATKYTLIGNPYPSALDLDAFLLDPANASVIDGKALFWDQVVVNSHYLNQYQGGYGTYTPGAGYTPADYWSFNGDGTYNSSLGTFGAVYPRAILPIGQGFMVEAVADGVITMKNAFRVYKQEGSESVFTRQQSGDKSQNENAKNTGAKASQGYVPQLRINAMFNKGGVTPTTLGFAETTTDGFDYGFDASSFSTSNPYRFFYMLENDPKEYLISVTKFDVNKKIPVGLVCTGTTDTNFRIKVMETLYGFDANQPVFMHDKETDVYYDMKNAFFDITLPAGEYKNRFEITFRDFSLDNNEVTFVEIGMYQNNVSGLLMIKNPTRIDLATLILYDVAGKQMMLKKDLGKNESYECATAMLSEGVYIAKITTKDGKEMTKKIAVSRK